MMDIVIFILSKVPKVVLGGVFISAFGYYSYLMINYFKVK